MSKVKLVIEIEHNEYTGIKNFPDGTTSYPWTLHLYDAVRNGTPLDDIKKEIFKLIGDTDSIYGTSALYKALEILDNIGKAENPETCKGCLEPCIMYEPDMRGVQEKGNRERR